MKKHYFIDPQKDGTVDVYLNPTVTNYPIADGFYEHDITFQVVRGIVPWDGLEDDIRHRYDAWCHSGETINL